MSFFKTIDDLGSIKAVQAALHSDNVFTSVVTVGAYNRLNIGIMIGSQVSDIVSAAGGLAGSVALGAAISALFSTASMGITLQRQMHEERGTAFWRDVDTWAVVTADGEAGSVENISDKAEPEITNYRLGVKTGDYDAGLAMVRLGTSQ